jgi:chromosomal replication initiation ATPase DnaA
MEEYSEVWRQTLAALKNQMSRATYEAHLAQCEVAHVSGSRWTIACAANSVDWLRNPLSDVVQQALSGITGEVVAIEWVAETAPTIGTHPANFPPTETASKVSMGGFTPVFDVIAGDEALGTTTALIFGVVWRHCQMKRGVCDASVPTLATLTGLSEKTVRRHLAALCTKGYLTDLTPDVRHRPHTYKDAGKIKFEISIKATT